MECKKQALELASHYFKRNADQLDTRDFVVYVRDTPELRVPMFKLAPKELSIVGYGKHMEMFNVPSCMAVFVEVEVDLDTGHITLCRMCGGADVGQIIDVKALEMQYEGGIGSACVDTAIFEENILDRATGRLLKSGVIDYNWRTFNEFPKYDGYVRESQIDSFMFKALGIGEISGAAGASAVLMAVSNAIGVDVKEYPATPSVILKSLGKC
jgi:CO/xanthine dehydrogenase Mo-binding subunit